MDKEKFIPVRQVLLVGLNICFIVGYCVDAFSGIKLTSRSGTFISFAC